MGDKETGVHSVTSEVSSKCPVGPGTQSGREHRLSSRWGTAENRGQS